jgi:hypothetical protein
MAGGSSLSLSLSLSLQWLAFLFYKVVKLSSLFKLKNTKSTKNKKFFVLHHKNLIFDFFHIVVCL